MIAERSDDSNPALTRAGPRAVVAAVALAVVWGAAFLSAVLPFFATIAAGGALTGLAGLWVRRGSRGWSDGDPEPQVLPGYGVTPGQAVLAVGVGVVHLGVGHALFAVGSLVLPEITATAAGVYGRASSVPLWVGLLVGGVLTAPLEEIFWRGAVQPLTGPWLTSRLSWLPDGPLGRIVGAAALYALFHVATGQLALVMAAALGGLVWGWLLDRTGSIGTTMIAHGVWTSLMLVVPPAGT